MSGAGRSYGRTRTQITADVGLSYTAVSKTIDRYETGGMSALAPQRRGRRAGEQRVLSAEQEARMQQMIGDHRPEQLKMDFALWSRAAVMQLIERECGMALQVRSVGKYLARWGFTPQKPVRRAYEQSPAAVRLAGYGVHVRADQVTRASKPHSHVLWVRRLRESVEGCGI
ncbi:transposase (fragment) [Thiomonas sp. X19]